MGVGFVVGMIAAPGPWVRELTLPPTLLPDYVNTVTWVVLCFAFAVSGWRLWLIDSSAIEMRLWLAILILSWWFGPLMFVARLPLAALVVIALLAVLMVVFIVRTWRVDRLSSILFIPCVAWVAYAAVMTAWLITLNPGL